MVQAPGEKLPVKKNLKDNISFLDEQLGVKENFDIIRRDIEFAGIQACFYFVDGLIEDIAMTHVMRGLVALSKENVYPNPLEKVFKRYLNYIEAEKTKDLHQIIDNVLIGHTALLIDGQNEAILLDVRHYPARTPDEPDVERVVRGARDGFVETIVFNTALIRRRLRDPQLRMEMLQAGQRSKTDICVSYINDIANPDLVKKIKNEIEKIHIDGLPMAEKAVEELLNFKGAWNPFPKVRYTERADVAAVHLLEGHVLILVDTSPSIMILPATYFHHLQHAEEYRQTPAVGLFLRWVRLTGVIISLFLIPLWLLFSLDRDLLPESLKFIGPADPGKINLSLQFLLAELGVNLTRMAAVHTPSALATALGLIAAILIGEIAVEVGLFDPEVILYVAVAAVGIFATPSYEMGMANSLVRIFFIIAVSLFLLPGLLAAVIIVLVFLSLTRSFGFPYLWPLIPLDLQALKAVLVRSPVPVQKYRPKLLQTLDASRKPMGLDKKQKARRRRRRIY